MPPAPPFDWNQIHDIAIIFGTFPTKANTHKHEALNDSFRHDLDDTAGLFITDDDADAEGPKTLAPDPITMLREIIVTAIMDILPYKERTADAIHFTEVYDTNIYSSPKKSNTRKATPVANKTPNASRARFANLQQQKYVTPKAVPLQRTHINTTARIPPVTADLGPLQSVGPIADTPFVKAPHATWTWTYSPQSELVSFRRVRCDSLLCVTSSSPPDHKEKSSIVTTPSVLPSAQSRFDHHSAPPWKPTNFVWTFNPQDEIATFRRLTKSVPPPSPLLPSEVLDVGSDPPNAAPAYIRSLQSPCHHQISSRPNHQPVLLRITKRHRDALKIKLYQLHANILSMNWFYDNSN
eukprot:jgi/Psemu1/27480/gm1.27480_g